MPEQFIAPVVEYKGIALIEKHGDKRTVWRGREYSTDGLTYLARKDTGDSLILVSLKNERTAKDFIDDLHEVGCFAVEGVEYPASDFLGIEALLGIIQAPQDLIDDVKQRRWQWDDLQGVFVDQAG